MTLTTTPPSFREVRTTSRRRRLLSLLAVTAVASASLVLGTVGAPASALTGETRMHDTAAIQVDGCTWFYSTGFERDADNPTGAVTMHRSCATDQASGWTDMGPIWDSVPAWITTKFNGITPPNYWAPDISFFDGQYHLYYAASLWQNNRVASMGLATADSPGGPWTDQGEVTDVNYPIDGAVTTDAAGALYITWGSWAGTYLHKLDPATGKLSTSDNSLVKVATGIENGTILYRDGYYYLFGSKGSCCSGVNSTYFTAVGRSTSLAGPYLDKTGKDMVTGAGSTILTGSGTQVAAGGGDWYEADGSLWFVYHYYDATDNGRETGNIRPMSIVDGWPVMGTPVGAITNSVPPSVSGVASPGEILSVDTGVWNVSDPQFAFTWLRNGTAIAGATDATYTATAEDLGQAISVSVTASRADRDSLTVTSATQAIALPTSLDRGLDAADGVDLAASTQASAELFAREVRVIRAASALPEADEEALLQRLGAAYSTLVSVDSLLVENPVARPWVTSSSPIFGGAGSAADNGWALFDGSLSTFVSGSTSTGSVTVTPTDGSTFTIDRLRVYPRGENLHSRLIGHRFEGSNDGGATWQTFATLSAAQAATWTTIDLPEQVAFDRVRMVDDHGGWINAAEAEFWERSVDRSLVDLLLSDATGIDTAVYTAETVAELRTAQAAAEALTNPSQAEADAASARLRSAIAGLVTLPASAPDAPARPSIGVSNTHVTVGFRVSETHGSAITGYEVTLAPVHGNGAVRMLPAGATAASLSFADVRAGSYRASVVALSAAGRSEPSELSATVKVTGSAPVKLGVNAKSQCINGVAHVAVYALNRSGDGVDIRLSTPFGEKKSAGVAAGTASYGLFSTSMARVDAGVTTVAGYRFTDGAGYYSTYRADFAAIDCS